METLHNVSELPLVSICIPAYNAGKYIAETLSCLIAQTYNNIEIIVVDDGSTDDTLAKANSIQDNRTKIITVQNGGPAKARNIAYSYSKGKYIKFFDADDLVDADFISGQLLAMNYRKDVVVCSAWGRFYQDDINTFKQVSDNKNIHDLQTWVEEYWYHANPMTNPGRILIPRELVEQAGGWNEALTLNDDMEFFTRIFFHASAIVYNENNTLMYRSGIHGLSAKKGEQAFLSLYNSIALSVDLVLKKQHSARIKKACANMWQLFIYDTYPSCPDLIKKAEAQIRLLGGASLPYPAGGITLVVKNMIGWKLTKRIKERLA